MGMPSLTRRRSDNPHQITWHVHYGDLHVGTIGVSLEDRFDHDLGGSLSHTTRWRSVRRRSMAMVLRLLPGFAFGTGQRQHSRRPAPASRRIGKRYCPRYLKAHSRSTVRTAKAAPR